MADGHEDWQQQVEELLALQAIYQDEFRCVHTQRSELLQPRSDGAPI